MAGKNINKIIKQYISDLSVSIKIDKVILFGSAVDGKIKNNSDIDLLVLSNRFKNMDVCDRFDLLYNSRKTDLTQSVPMDIFGLTLDEYNSASPISVIGEIKEKGKEIKTI